MLLLSFLYFSFSFFIFKCTDNANGFVQLAFSLFILLEILCFVITNKNRCNVIHSGSGTDALCLLGRICSIIGIIGTLSREKTLLMNHTNSHQKITKLRETKGGGLRLKVMSFASKLC